MRKIKVIASFFILSLVMIVVYAYADTEVSGLITEDTTWTLNNSPYVLVDKVGVDYQVILTVEPGVQVKSNAGPFYYIKVMGKIIAQGTSSNPIIFTALVNNPSNSGWGGFEFVLNGENKQSWEGSLFEWCEFSWLQFGIRSIEIYNQSENPILVVRNCKFLNISRNGISFEENCLIENNYFTKCGYEDSWNETQCIFVGNGSSIIGNTIENNYNDAIYAYQCEIFGNIIVQNQGNGILTKYSTMFSNIICDNLCGVICRDSTLTHNLICNNSTGVSTCNNTINYNSIFNNEKYYNISVQNDFLGVWDPCTIGSDATNNWWGTIDENEIQESIYDYYDDWELGEVNYTPWLIEPDPNVPTSSTTSTPNLPCIIEELYSEHSKEANLLRYFRDNILSQTSEGQEIISLYYQWSPVIVKAMVEDAAFKNEVNEMIDGILPTIRELVE